MTSATSRAVVAALLLALAASCDGSGSDSPADADADADADGTTDGDADAPGPGCRFEPGTVEDLGPCGCDLDCIAGAFCATETEFGFPSGVCMRGCNPEAPSCAAGAECLAVEGGEGMCWLSCETDEDCRRPTGACFGRMCNFFCQSDGECLSGHCDPYTGNCTDGTPSTGTGSFAPCLRDEDCRSGRCSLGERSYCYSLCRADSPGCPEGHTCIEALSWEYVDQCFPHCDTVADCPAPPPGYAFDCALPMEGPRDHALCILYVP